MAKSTKSTKAAVLDDTIEEAEETTTSAEPTTKQIINDGITRVLEASGVGVQHARYKAMRAIAFEAFAQHIEAGTFDDLVDTAIANIGDLPSGWEMERTEKTESPKPAKSAKAAKPAEKAAPAKKSATKGDTKTARRRPTR